MSLRRYVVPAGCDADLPRQQQATLQLLYNFAILTQNVWAIQVFLQVDFAEGTKKNDKTC